LYKDLVGIRGGICPFLKNIEATIQALPTISPAVAITVILLEVAAGDEIGREQDEESDDLEDGHGVPNMANILCNRGSAQAAVRAEASGRPCLTPCNTIRFDRHCCVIPNYVVAVAAFWCLATCSLFQHQHKHTSSCHR
jgi:hypothetical protein